MIPKGFSRGYVVDRPVPYQAEDHEHDGALPSRGMLEIGRIVWTAEPAETLRPGAAVKVYAEGVGAILLDPVCLRSLANGGSTHCAAPRVGNAARAARV